MVVEVIAVAILRSLSFRVLNSALTALMDLV